MTENGVVFRHENEDFILQKAEIGLKRYDREFGGKNIVEFTTTASHQHVKQFFSFLRFGEVPTSFEDQVSVFQLLKEWESHFTVLDSFRVRIQSFSKNGYLIHKNIKYPINIGCLFFHCPVFEDFCLTHPQEVFCLEHECSSKSVGVFLDLVHSRIELPELEDSDEVLDLCRFLKCYSLYALINESSPEAILSTIIRKQDDDSFDFSFYEGAICDQLKCFIQLSEFGQVCLPYLCLIFQKTNIVFSICDLEFFFKHCVDNHGSKSFVLLSMIQFEPAKNVEELNFFFNTFRDKKYEDFFSINSRLFNDFAGQFSEMETKVSELTHIKEENDKKITELLGKMDNFDKLLQHYQTFEKDVSLKFDEEKKIRDSLLQQLNEQSQIIEKKNFEISGFIAQIKHQNEEERKSMDAFNQSIMWRNTKPPNFERNAFIATAKGNLSNIIYLLSNGTFVDQRFSTEQYEGIHMKDSTLLHFACRFGHIMIVEYLVDVGADINSKNSKNETPLRFSASNNHLDVFEYLLNQGADFGDGINGESYLHWSSRNGYLSFVECLVNHQAEVNAKNSKNETPLLVSASNNHLDVFEYLLNQGADFGDGINGESYLHWSSRNGYLSFVECLVNHQAEVNAKNSKNETPLHLSSSSGHLSVVEYLVNHQAEVNAKDSSIIESLLIGLLSIMQVHLVMVVLLNF